MGYDYKEFFAKAPTQQVIEQEFVKEEDIDGENYVDGSQGELKVLKMVSEDDTDKIGGKIAFQQKVFTFCYEDLENPSKSTSIETKVVRREVD